MEAWMFIQATTTNPDIEPCRKPVGFSLRHHTHTHTHWHLKTKEEDPYFETLWFDDDNNQLAIVRIQNKDIINTTPSSDSFREQSPRLVYVRHMLMLSSHSYLISQACDLFSWSYISRRKRNRHCNGRFTAAFIPKWDVHDSNYQLCVPGVVREHRGKMGSENRVSHKQVSVPLSSCYKLSRFQMMCRKGQKSVKQINIGVKVRHCTGSAARSIYRPPSQSVSLRSTLMIL
jgi:hypothetical protein